MKQIFICMILFSVNLQARELCDDNNFVASEVHYIDADPLFFAPLEKTTTDLTPIDLDFDMKVKFELIGFESFRGGEKVASDIEIARKRLEKILVSKIFQEKIHNKRYKKNYQFKKNNGKTNQEIHQIILDGADKYNRTVDNQIDMILCPYYSKKRVLGYTYKNRKEVWLNFKYYRDNYNNFNISGMIGNLLHEWIHNADFTHAHRKNSTRKHTVPYAAGYFARGIARSLD